MQNFNNRRKLASVSKKTDQQGKVGIHQSFFSLMKTKSWCPLIFVTLTWNTDEQFSSLWLGKACTYTTLTAHNWLFCCQFYRNVTLSFQKARNWDENSRKPADCLCGPDVRLRSLLWYRFNYSKQMEKTFLDQLVGQYTEQPLEV